MKGQVVLVGAGPGHPGLLTLRGKEVLDQADVVVYDRLVGKAILAQIPPGAQAIDVGKVSSNHTLPQDQINQLLLEQAQAGNLVVRLKGGDPFLFGRGGEELSLLAAHHIPFEVVPGVTSAIAVPSFGGIPVTHRSACSSLHIITGHARAGKELDIDYQALVRSRGTLVFLMGVHALPKLVEGLLAGGMAPEMPASMVEQGTTPAQRRIDAPLAQLPQKAREQGVKSPAVIVVGEVCALAEDFAWYEKLPLKGQRILVTRPQERIGVLSHRLSNLGAEVLEYPCIHTQPLEPCPALAEALSQLSQYQWLCFTSPAGVDCFWKGLEALNLDPRALGGVKLAVIGPGTAKALHPLRPDLMPETYDVAHLGEALAKTATGKVLILRAQEGSPHLVQALESAGVDHQDVAIYRTLYHHPQSQALRQEAEAGDLPYATFTSASTVKGFVSTVGEGADLSRVTALCIGEQTAQEAKAQGMPVKIAKKATIDALVDLICQVIEEETSKNP